VTSPEVPVDVALVETSESPAWKSQTAFRLVGRPLDEAPPDPFADRIPLPPLAPCLSLAEKRKQKSRIRAKQWRDEQKQQNPDFKKKEAERKQAEREEADRKKELAELLASGQFPTNLYRLRDKSGPPLTAINEFGETTTLVSGEYNTEKLEQVEIAHINAQGGPDAVAKPKSPTGHGDDSLKPNTALRYYGYLPSKEMKAMRKFIDNHTTQCPMMCSVCREQIAPELSYEVGFNHFHDKHLQLFEDMMRLVRTAKRCPEDHEGMIARHGNGTRKLYCGKCRKLLYKPPKLPKPSIPPMPPEGAFGQELVNSNSL